MKLLIRRIPPHPAAKLMAVLWFAISVVFLIPMALFMPRHDDAPAGMMAFMLGMPLLYLLFGYVMTWIACWVYNQLAPRLGPLQIEVEREAA